ncbi:MAG: FliM/FliN family flagellar motor switch protein [Phycisphaerae bacterium]
MDTSQTDSSEGHQQARPQDSPRPRSDSTPTARQAGDAFARDLAQAVSKRVSPNCTATLTGLSAETLADFHASMQAGGAVMLLKAHRSGPSAEPTEMLLEISPAPAFALIDALLGGEGGQYVPRRPANETELRLLSRVANEPARRFLQSVLPGGSAPAVVEAEPAPAEPQKPAESVLVVRIALTVGQSAGTLRLAVPRALFPQVGEGQRGENLVQITVDATDANLRSEDLRDLAPGDILVTDLPADGEVAVRVAGIAKFAGRLAAGNGRRAVHITNRDGETTDQ